jgi:hypothetical protein
MKHKLLRIGLGVAALLVAQGAFANKISIIDLAGDPITAGKSPGATQYFASCGVPSTNCMEAFVGDPATLSTTLGTGYALNENPTGEQAFLNGLLADVGLPAVSSVDKTDVAGTSFTTNREYFSIKQSTWTVFFKNISGESITVSFGPNAYSHHTEYGSPVPLPAAAWLFLSALGVFGFMGARRNKES